MFQRETAEREQGMSTQGRAQFTPGPWVAERDTARNAYAWKVTGAKGVVEDIARLALVDSVSQIEANATLIAAAPTMYADLCAVRDYLFELYDEGNAKAGEYAASLGITIEQAEGRHHE